MRRARSPLLAGGYDLPAVMLLYGMVWLRLHDGVVVMLELNARVRTQQILFPLRYAITDIRGFPGMS